MPLSHINLPAAGQIAFSGGDVDYLRNTDPVYAGKSSDTPYPYSGPDNRPLRNLAYRDNQLGAKINEVIDSLSDFVLWLAPFQQTVPNNTVLIHYGRYIQSNGDRIVNKPTDFSSPVFPVVAPGMERYDLLVMNDAGTAEIIPGTPVTAGTGDPIVNCPNIPNKKLAVAVVKVNETATVVINTADITDVREFLNKGSAGAAQCGVDYSLQIATGGQTIFNLPFSYITGSGRLHVYKNRSRLIKGVHYTESSATQITLLVGAVLSDKLVFVGMTSEESVNASYETQTAAPVQTVFNLGFSFSMGSGSLAVFKAGTRLYDGTGYTETGASQVTLATPCVGGEVMWFEGMCEIVGIDSCVNNYSEQVAAPAQTTFTLGFNYSTGAHRLFVYKDGLLQVVGTDYLETGATQVDFLTPMTGGERIAFENRCAGTGGGGGIAGVRIEDEGTLINPAATAMDFVGPGVDATDVGGGKVQVEVAGGLVVKDEGSALGFAKTMSFEGPGVTASLVGDDAHIVIPGGGGGGICPGPTMYQVMTAIQGQTTFNLASSYTMGTNALWVFRNGARQIHSSDYTEVTPTQITFNYALNAGEQVVFVQMGSTSGNMAVAARQEFIATAGQTVFNTAFTFTPNSNELFVWSGGVLQWIGAGNDYTETGATQVTFNTIRSTGERIIIARIGDSSASAMKLWEKHIATAAQAVFNLAGIYTVGSHSLQVFRNGKMLTVTDEYTETGPSTVTLGYGATVGDVFVFMVAGGDVVACVQGGLLQYERQTATANQTVFNLGFNYNPGLYGLMVTRNGQVLRPTVDYAETSTNIVTFVSGCLVGDQIEFRNFCQTNGLDEGILLWYKFPSVTIGQALFTLPFHYAMGTHHLVVMRNGAYQLVGSDYTENGPDQITFSVPMASTTEEIIVYTIAHAKTVGAHAMALHSDWIERVGTLVWDPPSIANGASATNTVSIPGAAFGHFVMLSASASLLGLQLTGYVSAADTVTLVLGNLTGGAVDLTSTTFNVRVIQRS